jgi:hypothetical protein
MQSVTKENLFRGIECGYCEYYCWEKIQTIKFTLLLNRPNPGLPILVYKKSLSLMRKTIKTCWLPIILKVWSKVDK